MKYFAYSNCVYCALLFVLMFATTSVVFANDEYNRILGFLQTAGTLISSLIAIGVALAFLYFFWHAFQLIRSTPGKDVDRKKNLLAGVIAIAVLTSVWGIIYFLQIAVFGVNSIGFSRSNSGTPACVQISLPTDRYSNIVAECRSRGGTFRSDEFKCCRN